MILNRLFLLIFSAVCTIAGAIVERACVGELLTLACINDRSTFTVWHGTAFDCPSSNDQIFFLNQDFDSSATKSCIDSDSVIIVAQAVSVEDSVYLTQLNFTAMSLLHGEEVTIQCDYDDGIVSKVITNYSILVEDCNTVTVTLSTNELANNSTSTKDMMKETTTNIPCNQ